jgi:hypothetical protein
MSAFSVRSIITLSLKIVAKVVSLSFLLKVSQDQNNKLNVMSVLIFFPKLISLRKLLKSIPITEIFKADKEL